MIFNDNNNSYITIEEIFSESEIKKNTTDEDSSTDTNDEKEKFLFKLTIPKDCIEFEPLTVLYKDAETCRS